MFLGRRQRSREESPEWICESRCRQVSVRLHVFAGFFLPLNPTATTVICSVWGGAEIFLPASLPRNH